MGVWYDPSDLSSMFQDSTGTTPAVVDSPVGRINDKSGNGKHAIQATSANRPILRQSGGLYWLESDGVNDSMAVAFTVAQPWDRVSALRQLTWVSQGRVFGGLGASTGVLFQFSASPSLALYDGVVGSNNLGAAVGADAVVTEHHAGASSSTQINQTAAVVSNFGTSLPGGITLFADNNGGAQFTSIRLYGVCEINRALTTLEKATLQSYMAAKSGVTL